MSNHNGQEISAEKEPPPPVLSQTGGDVLRLGAMIAVLVIHATGRWEWAFRANHSYFSEDFAAVLLNQLGRYCVPLFVLLSGYGLGRKYSRSWAGGYDWPAGLREFYSRRFLKIGVPFLVWTLGLLLLGGRFAFTGADGFASFLEANVIGNLKVLAPYLYRRGADYHFYFFIIILQMYLLFPYLFRAVRSLGPAGRRVLLFCFFGWQLIWTWPSVEIFRWLGWPRPIFPTAFLVYWVFYFYAGMYFALRGDPADGAPSATGRTRRTALALIGVTFAFAVMLAEYLGRSYVDADPGYYNHFSRWSVVLYSICAFVLLVAFDESIERFFAVRPVLHRWLNTGAAITFSVYLFHTWILRAIDATIVGRELFATIIALTLISFALAYALHKIVRPNWLRTILGLP